MTTAASLEATLSERAERRQLTIMFCDLVDSVGLSTRLDPEDLRDVIGAYYRACARSIDQYSGYVARYLGDGVLIYFGYPEAHEDDAGRAVRAALDLVQTVAKLNDEIEPFPDLDLRVRIGVATGLVVVGDEPSGVIAEIGAVTGEAANLAARLQALAGSNGIVVSAATRQLAGEAFAYHDLGPQQLKGFSRPMAAYQVVGEREISRLMARSTAQTPFVGRDAEIAMLLAAWQSVAAGSGRVVIIAGEAGIGKSRIAAEAYRRIDHGAAALPSALLFQCSPYHVNEPLYPIVKELQRTARLDRAAEPRENFDRLRLPSRRSRMPSRCSATCSASAPTTASRCRPPARRPDATSPSTRCRGGSPVRLCTGAASLLASRTRSGPIRRPDTCSAGSCGGQATRRPW